MRWLRFCVALGAVALSAPAWACAPDAVTLRGPGGVAQFIVEIADDGAERAQGLMNRPSMPRFSGMLFVYERPQTVGFWMRNTLIPLDILFADESGTVRRIHANATPLSEETIPGGDEIQYVLEINGGLAEELGIAPGTTLRHPSIDPSVAAWPCPDS